MVNYRDYTTSDKELALSCGCFVLIAVCAAVGAIHLLVSVLSVLF